MGQINNILYKDFRNFKTCELSFNPRCNILYGLNGSGKTNILEGISLLGKGRGFRNASLPSLIYKNSENFIINSEYEENSTLYNLKIFSKLMDLKYKKITSVNDEISKDSENHLNSSISFLFFLPEMERLFLASPSYRRNFIDKLIFSENKNYNKLINKYKKNILERSKVLQLENYDRDWLDIIENDISALAIEIYQLRNKKVHDINDQIAIINKDNQYPFNINMHISDKIKNDNLDIKSYTKLLYINRDFDTKFGGSKIGPHKSEIVAFANEKINASQLSTGQQKTLVLMILIAQCNYLISIKKISPILLFDEICSHLDITNRDLLLKLTDQFDIQLFLTGTEKSMFSFMSTNTNFYNITKL